MRGQATRQQAVEQRVMQEAGSGFFSFCKQKDSEVGFASESVQRNKLNLYTQRFPGAGEKELGEQGWGAERVAGCLAQQTLELWVTETVR